MAEPTAAPTRKVIAGALAGALSIVVAYCVKQFTHTDVPPEISAALQTIFTVVVMYAVPDAE